METTCEYIKQAQDFLKATNTTLTTEFNSFDYHFPGDKDKRNIFNCTISRGEVSFSFKFGSSINDSCKEIALIDSNSKELVSCGGGISIPNLDLMFATKLDVTYQQLKQVSTGELKTSDLYNCDDIQKELTDFINNEHCLHIDKSERDNAIRKRLYRVNKKTNRGYTKSDYLSNVLKYMKLDKITSVLDKHIKCEIVTAERSYTPQGQKDTVIHPTEYDILACLTTYDPESHEEFCSNYGYDVDSIQGLNTYNAVQEEYKNVCMIWNSEEVEQLAEIN